MNFLSRQVVFQEVPQEISLSYLITGCSLRCPGCHSPDAWDQTKGSPLTLEGLFLDIKKYSSWITCVLFMGGEWHGQELVSFLKEVQRQELKTALYTGETELSPEILSHLDYVKYGRYDKNLGGLGSRTTNQRFINLRTNELMNFHFEK